ncbi:Permease of the drug/metabolite transporter (DMT) superfamily [Rhizobium sp. RU20A]|uniref:DMT family transporter n=1 Tax=Rhizobium sp. RU20A TaxID=1907412 RepID=UPI0009552D5B|nr:DMT family transporter [Rhizobium sp. RU20A]SIQ29403.1 Permease of the drug/metabolite transporter (DMT) superfamily [Rhizobium sp. RU20A]
MTLDRLAPAIFVLLWSSGWVLAKYVGPYADPFTLLALRNFLTAVAFAAIVGFAGASWLRRPRDIVHALVTGVFLHGLYLAGVWWAVRHGVPAALSGIIAGLQPLMTVAAAPLMIGERVSRLQVLGIFLGFVGISIAVLPRVLAIDPGVTPISLVAVGVNVLGMASVTLGTLYQKKFLPHGDLRAVATLQYVGALMVTLPLALVFEPEHRLVFGWPLVFILFWSVVVLSMGAVGLLLYLIRRGQVSRAASLIYLVPPLAAVQAAIVFGEALTGPMILGTVIAVTGVWLTNRKAKAQPVEVTPAE